MPGGGFPGGGMPGGGMPTGAMPTGAMPTGGMPGGGAGGGAGGLLDASTPSSQLTKLLQADADQYDWVAATTGAQSAAGYQLAADEAVMPIGGFNGSDASPTLAQFKAWVAAGRVHYYIASGGGMGGGGMGGSQNASAIASWVSSTFTATTVDGVTLYDLTAS